MNDLVDQQLPCPQSFSEIDSPQLVIFESAVANNLEAMVRVLGGAHSVASLRPHLKTHKTERLTRMQMDRGVVHFKASTIGEVAMAARAGAKSVLLAHQPVAKKIDAIAELSLRFPQTSMAVIVDDLDHARLLCDQYQRATASQETPLQLMIDVDVGMHRTGVSCDDALLGLWSALNGRPDARLLGLHVYDGHLHQSDLSERRRGVDEALQQLLPVLNQLDVGSVVVGGTPTFELWVEAVQAHQDATDWQFSPGTCTLWDWGYGDAYPDLPFTIGAGVLTRVVSHPSGRLDDQSQCVCLDLGTKAIAAEMSLEDRVRIHGLPEARLIAQSEEHLVISVSKDRELPIGTPLWALPKHICPTVARYDRALVCGGTGGDFDWQGIEPRDGIKNA
ncbi:MAG: alanine racemase [Planctomycetota bacterium]